MNIMERFMEWKVEQVLAHLEGCSSVIKYR